MNAPEYFDYDCVTGEYIPTGKPVYATKSPRDGEWLTPAWATMKRPPDAIPGYAMCFRGGDWVQIEDHRGEVAYKKADAGQVVIDGLGHIPEELTLLEPCRYPVWNGTDWIEDVEAAKREKITELAEYRRSKANFEGAMTKHVAAWSDPISYDTALEILVSALKYIQACDETQREHTDRIMARSSIDEIMAYDITTGWPEE